MKKFIHIRGSMGTGKTTTVRQFLQKTGGFTLHQIKVQGKLYPYHYNKEMKILITGLYGRRNCDGLDGEIDNRDIMMAYLMKLVDTIKPEVVVFEAIMYGVTVKFGLELDQKLKERDYEYIGLALVPPYEFTLSNILTRNGGKKINTKQLKSKWLQGKRSAEKLIEEGVNIKIIDTSKYRMNNMDILIERELSTNESST